MYSQIIMSVTLQKRKRYVTRGFYFQRSGNVQSAWCWSVSVRKEGSSLNEETNYHEHGSSSHISDASEVFFTDNVGLWGFLTGFDFSAGWTARQTVTAVPLRMKPLLLWWSPNQNSWRSTAQSKGDLHNYWSSNCQSIQFRVWWCWCQDVIFIWHNLTTRIDVFISKEAELVAEKDILVNQADLKEHLIVSDVDGKPWYVAYWNSGHICYEDLCRQMKHAHCPLSAWQEFNAGHMGHRALRRTDLGLHSVCINT